MDDTEAANVLNKSFVDAVRLLSVINFNTIDDPIENIMHWLKNQSVIAIKKVVSRSFNFKPLTVEVVLTEIFKMNHKS